MKRENVLAKAGQLITGDIKVSVRMVYLCLLALKISRLVKTPSHTDSWVDICGYGALGAEEKDDK